MKVVSSWDQGISFNYTMMVSDIVNSSSMIIRRASRYSIVRLMCLRICVEVRVQGRPSRLRS